MADGTKSTDQEVKKKRQSRAAKTEEEPDEEFKEEVLPLKKSRNSTKLAMDKNDVDSEDHEKQQDLNE